MLKFHVPPGLGDISWLYVKLEALARERVVGFAVAADTPKRSKPFVSLLPNIVNLGYTGKFYNRDIKANILDPATTDLAALADGTYYLSLNPWIESGNHLKDAFPKQLANFHYEMELPVAPEELELLSADPRPKIGVYCSSTQHRPRLGHWEVEGWMRFLGGVKHHLGDVTFVVVGAPYDNKTKQVAAEIEKLYPCFKFLNQPPGVTYRIMQQLSYFFSFPSGLGIMADVLNVPCMMWFWGNLAGWEHHRGLFGKYADPEHVQSGFHITAPYASPDQSVDLFLQKGAAHVRRK